jgi:hypothetical protein
MIVKQWGNMHKEKEGEKINKHKRKRWKKFSM